MVNKDYEHIVLTKENFGDNLYNVLGQLLKILLKGGYECQVYDDDTDIIVINFNHASFLDFGNSNIEWLTPEESEYMYAMWRENTDNM